MIRFAIALLLLAISVSLRAETISLRFIVSDDLGRNPAQQQATRDKLLDYVGTLNAYYRNSQVNLQADIAQIEFTHIAAQEDLRIVDDMTHERDGFADMFSKTYQYHADFTVAMVSTLLMQGKPGCGRAYAVNQSVQQIADPRRAFAVVNFVCGAHTLAHELGHLMGLNHGTLVATCNPGQGHTSAVAPYANGFAAGNCDGKLQAGEFGDIMVGGHMREIMGNDKGNLPIFSNPRLHDIRCGAQHTCGDPATGDAARALNENAHYYAAHKNTQP